MFNLEYQKARSVLYRKIRDFFDSRNYTEIFTPTLSPSLIPEPTIYNFKSRYENEFSISRDFYLIPSPEIFMKEVIANTNESVYQISTCFRNSEQIGKIHNPEFSMLEYYTVGFDENDSISLTEELIKNIRFENTKDSVLPPFAKMSVNEAMIKYASSDLDKLQNNRKLKDKALSLGLSISEEESWDDTFNRIFIQFVEPNLPKEKPVLLYDYPTQIECLAKGKDGKPYKRRWEAYFNGMEVMNCYCEETDTNVIQEYYKREFEILKKDRKEKGMVIPEYSKQFPLLELPETSGVAIGLDRLLAVLLGIDSIKPLLLFPFSPLLETETMG